MSEENDLENCIQNLSCDDTCHSQQQDIKLQKLVTDLRQQLAQQQRQLEQQQIQIEQYKLEMEQQKWQFDQHQIKCPQQNAKPIIKQQSPPAQQTPFKIVLIDIKQAAQDIIHCVEKPLFGNEDLKYVALSYRWGELHETTVNTGLDYIATVTSFHLNDFFALCQAMTRETDLQHMEYVWVDAICVDQKNKERRKATIYQMTNIYNRANYILAVPDLHLTHRIRLSDLDYAHYQYIAAHDQLMFHLLHGNADQLVQMDNDGQQQDGENNQATPLSQQMSQLETSIMYLLDIITDWSTRVWVISEYSIGKKTKIMKYWFIQLSRDYAYRLKEPQPESFYLTTFSFFEFDFHLTIPPELKFNILSHDTDRIIEWKNQLKSSYNHFHSRMLLVLGQKQFLETILKSKASRNDDRFHAVLPSSSKYKHIIENKVDSWEINDLISVKLKLFEFMETDDKLKLLFLSGSIWSLSSCSNVLPTFATSFIYWPSATRSYFELCDSATGWNFNLSNKKTISIKCTTSDGAHKLNIKPIQYFKGFGESSEIITDKFWTEQNTNGKQFGFDEHLQVVYIPMFHFESTDNFVNEYYENEDDEKVQFILLVGNFERNIWLLYRGYELSLDTKDIIMGDSFGTDIGFDIY